MPQDRYGISISYNEAAKCDLFHVRDNNGSLVRSTRETRAEALAAIKKYIGDDERKARDAQ